MKNIKMLFLTFILVLIIVGISVWVAFNNKVEKVDISVPTVETNYYADNSNIVSFVEGNYDNKRIMIIDNKYSVAYISDGDVMLIFSITNLHTGKTVYYNAGGLECYHLFEGIDNTLYVSSGIDQYDDKVNGEVIISRIADRDVTEAYRILKNKDQALSLIMNNDTDKVMGYELRNINNSSTTFINIDNKEYDMSVVNEFIGGGSWDDDYKINSSNYIPVKKDGKYGLYGVKEDKIVIDFKYDYISTFKNDVFKVLSDHKYGLVDKSDNVLLTFDYDYIQYYDNYYIVGKNYKLALLDKNLNNIIDFVFDYVDSKLLTCGVNCDGINGYMLGDKYIIDSYSLINKKTIRKLYLIDKNGNYQVFDNLVDEDSIIYELGDKLLIKNNMDYKVYDNELNYLYTIYGKGILVYRMGNTVVIDNNFYDIYTGMKRLDDNGKIELFTVNDIKAILDNDKLYLYGRNNNIINKMDVSDGYKVNKINNDYYINNQNNSYFYIYSK